VLRAAVCVDVRLHEPPFADPYATDAAVPD
jgi:hypothetical protein